MAAIRDYKGYVSEMRKGLIDKLFFLDKIPNDVGLIVDYGCADGAMIAALADENMLGDSAAYVGYDIDNKMVTEASITFSVNSIGAFATSNWEDVEKSVEYSKKKGHKTLLVFSSVLHEVFSYATHSKSEVAGLLLKRMRIFDYIVIRDMMYVPTMKDTDTIVDALVKPFPSGDVAELYKDYVTARDNEPASENGNYYRYKQPPAQKFVEFLLKYRYTANWERERDEYYFAATEFLNTIKDLYGYETVYIENFTHPYTALQVKEDFGIDLSKLAKTHVKMILKKDV